ncbi:serine/threonine-protein kinase [Streptomyces sp. NK15101]|uniref:serine/threonine-protein kinase n=1 Tax=Streptomyces sp. NK15101 TaxID=2873261 RepID=UPI001CECAC07|nr:serine/threonine-protein kinase [Streptomyces sp. NK15101]
MPQAGDVLDGRYRLDAELGAGGFGTVWRARDLRMNREVAVKTGLPATADEARRFVREAELAGSLSHPNIVTVHDFAHITVGGREVIYLVMELVRGESLATVLGRGLPDFQASLAWAEQICAALGAAHAAGIVHRDIKPPNVIVGESGPVKVLDFGIAKHRLSQTNLTGTGNLIGSFAYMAPERCRGGAVDGRSDLYALGCLLMELWTGRLPFLGREWPELSVQHMTAPPPTPSAFAPALTATADRLVLDLLAKDPGRRPPSAAAVAQRLAVIAREARQTRAAHGLHGPHGTHRVQDAPPIPATPAIPAIPTAREPQPQSQPDPQPRDRAVEPPPLPPYTPTVLDATAEPVRAALRRRLDQILALPDDADTGEFQELLDALVPEAQRELGPDDPLTTEAVLVRARHLWRRDPADPGLSRVVPKLVRVFGERDRRTIEARALLLSYEANAEHPGREGRAAARGELRGLVDVARLALGPYDPVTLHARAALARSLCWSMSRDRQEDVKRRRALVEPLLPDLAVGLPADDPERLYAHETVAHDAYLLADYAAAARYYDELAAFTGGDDRDWLVQAVLAHGRSLGESGEFTRAAETLARLKKRLAAEPGPMSHLVDEVHRLETRYRRKARRQDRPARSWFR